MADTQDHEFAGIGRFAANVLQVLRRNLGIILLAQLAAFGSAVVYIVSATPMFTARSQLLIDARFSNILREQIGDLASSLDAPQVESQLAVLRSEQVALRVIAKLNLLEHPGFGGGAAPSQNAPDDVSVRKMQSTVANFQRGLDIRRLGLSYVLEISYSSPDPEMAARLANAIADAYVEDQITARSEAAQQGTRWLEAQLNILRHQMNSAALKVQAFKAKRDYRLPSMGESDPDTKEASRAAATSAINTIEELEVTALTYRKIYEGFLHSYAESVQRQSYPVTNARVITKATRPSNKSSPRKALIFVLAAIGGTLLGLGGVFIMEALRYPFDLWWRLHPVDMKYRMSVTAN